MRIGIVLHPYDEDNPAGLARTIFEFTKGMLEVDEKNEYIIFVKNKPRRSPELPGKNWRLESLGGGVLWLDKMRNAPRADVYVFNTPVLPLFWKPPKSVVIALDFAYWYLSPRTVRGQAMKYGTYFYNLFSLFKADRIVAISHATKEETVRLFKIPEKKVNVVHCGFKKICELPEEKITLPEKFFLFIGVIKPRKNVFNIVKAFHEFQKQNSDYFLVITGSGGGEYYDGILRYIKINNMEKKVVFLGFVSDNNLSYIYKRAYAFIFPTLIEGFGYPTLEAMDCGIPVITSNLSSLKEIGETSALLVNPHTPSDIAYAMGRIVDEHGLRDTLIKKGKERAKQFSWQKAGRELLEVVKFQG